MGKPIWNSLQILVSCSSPDNQSTISIGMIRFYKHKLICASKDKNMFDDLEFSYQNFMIHKGTKSFSTCRFDFRPEIFDRIDICKINMSLIWWWASWTILLYIHGEQANIHTFNLLKQENGLYKTQKLVQDSYNYLLDIGKWDILVNQSTIMYLRFVWKFPRILFLFKKITKTWLDL